MIEDYNQGEPTGNQKRVSPLNPEEQALLTLGNAVWCYAGNDTLVTANPMPYSNIFLDKLNATGLKDTLGIQSIPVYETQPHGSQKLRINATAAIAFFDGVQHKKLAVIPYEEDRSKAMAPGRMSANQIVGDLCGMAWTDNGDSLVSRRTFGNDATKGGDEIEPYRKVLEMNGVPDVKTVPASELSNTYILSLPRKQADKFFALFGDRKPDIRMPGEPAIAENGEAGFVKKLGLYDTQTKPQSMEQFLTGDYNSPLRTFNESSHWTQEHVKEMIGNISWEPDGDYIYTARTMPFEPAVKSVELMQKSGAPSATLESPSEASLFGEALNSATKANRFEIRVREDEARRFFESHGLKPYIKPNIEFTKPQDIAFLEGLRIQRNSGADEKKL